MKRLTWSMYVLGVCVALSATAAGQNIFERHYGGERWDTGTDVLEMPGGGFLLLGTTRSVSNDTTDAWVVRTDALGDPIWTNTYGGSMFDSGISLLPASDGGYVFAVATNSFSDSYDIHLVRIDDAGAVAWAKTYGGSGSDYAHEMAPTADGGYVVVAHTMSFGAGGLDFYLLKVAQNGDSLWSRTYGGADWDWGGSVRQTADGGYILTGDTKSYGDANGDIFLVKTDAAGDTLWTRTYGWPYEPDRATCVLQTADGGYLLAGESAGAGSASVNGIVIKTDALGNEEWTTVLNGAHSSSLGGALQLGNGDYIVVGDAYRSEARGFDAYAARIAGDGTVISEWFYGDASFETFSAVRSTADDGFVFIGLTESLAPALGAQVYLVKTDADGNVTGVHDAAGDPRPQTTRLLGNHPNPFNPSTTLHFELSHARNVTLTVHDLYGRELRRVLDGAWREAGAHRVVFDAAGLPSGVYAYRITAGGHTDVKRMVLLR